MDRREAWTCPQYSQTQFQKLCKDFGYRINALRPREYIGPEGSVISEKISTESQMKKSHEAFSQDRH